MNPAYHGGARSCGGTIGDKREIANALYNSSFQYAITTEPEATRTRTGTGRRRR